MAEARTRRLVPPGGASPFFRRFALHERVDKNLRGERESRPEFQVFRWFVGASWGSRFGLGETKNRDQQRDQQRHEHESNHAERNRQRQIAKEFADVVQGGHFVTVEG